MTDSKPERTGAAHVLPFEKLSPEDFERMCMELVMKEGFESIQHLGAAGTQLCLHEAFSRGR